MAPVNALLDRFFELLLSPLAPLPVVASLVVVSLTTAIAMLLVIRVTSNQQGLTAAKRQMYADLLEMRLFKDDLRAMWCAQWSLCRHNLGYVRLALVPALWILVPFALTVVQLQCYFGYTGVRVSEPVLVTASLKSREFRDIALALPSGLRLETPAIWFPALQQVVWRVVADSTGDYVLRLRASGAIHEKTLHVSNTLARRSPLRPPARLIDQMLNPSEAPLPDSAPLTSIGVAYTDRRIDLFGIEVGWIDAYLVLSFVFAIALKRPSSGLA